MYLGDHMQIVTIPGHISEDDVSFFNPNTAIEYVLKINETKIIFPLKWKWVLLKLFLYDSREHDALDIEKACISCNATDWFNVDVEEWMFEFA
jgi:hypothetical protein